MTKNEIDEHGKPEKDNLRNGDDYWIGFDLGGTKMLSIVFDSDFNPIGKSRKKN